MSQNNESVYLPVEEKKNKGKMIGMIIGILILAGIIAAAVFYIWKPNQGPDDSIKVFVTNVGELTGTGNISGAANRYSGIVETQKSVTVEKDGEMEVDELKVKVGDIVKEGDVLFTYDTDSLKLSKSEKELEVEQLQSENDSSVKQVEQINKEMQKVKAEDKFQYEYQILQLQTTIKKNEYDIKSKKLEIKDIEKTINDNKVKSEIDGIVKTINDSNSTDDQQTDSGFITIMAVGNYRIKGTVNEQNVRNLSEGDAVTVYSRVDSSITWKGTIDSIDTDHTEENSQSDYYYDGGGASGSTNYPFYVELDSVDGLMMGQHVYIEMGDAGSDQEIKMALYEGYLFKEGGADYVWAKDENEKLQKRKVTLGEYDEDFETYVIVEGLSPEDYIAWPSDALQEGMAVTTNASQANVPETDSEGDDSAIDSSEEDGTLTDDSELDDSTFDDSELDDSTFDDSELDDSTFDDAELDDSTLDDSELEDSKEGDLESDDSASESIESVEGE